MQVQNEIDTQIEGNQMNEINDLMNEINDLMNDKYF